MVRWSPRSVAAVALSAVAAAVIVALAVGASSSDRDTSTPPSTETPKFPPIRGDLVRAVRTGTALVLPVTGGGPGAWEVVTPCANTAVLAGEPLTGAHVVLDPGHGGTETGAIGPNGTTEAELNLDVAVRAARLLRSEGATVVMTRTSDVRVTLETRTRIALALEPLAFVSIHHNAAPRGTRDRPGSELYHQQSSSGSKRLAGLIWEELQEELGPFSAEWAVGDAPGAMARPDVDTGDDYYGVLRGSQGVPAVLAEAAYISTPAEEALLGRDEVRDAEAEAISDAVLRFVTTDDPGSGFRPPRVVDTPSGGGGGTAGCEDPPLS